MSVNPLTQPNPAPAQPNAAKAASQPAKQIQTQLNLPPKIQPQKRQSLYQRTLLQ